MTDPRRLVLASNLRSLAAFAYLCADADLARAERLAAELREMIMRTGEGGEKAHREATAVVHRRKGERVG